MFMQTAAAGFSRLDIVGIINPEGVQQ